MTQLHQIYKCNICGNIVTVLHTGAGELVCCGKPMQLLKENTEDAAEEKHVPVIESGGKCECGCEGECKVVKVKVGSLPHPMDKDHYIEWIELIAGDKVRRKFLKPGDKPEAEFCCISAEKVTAREYCNLHGLWKAEK